MQRTLAVLGDAISDGALEFSHQGQHGTADFTERREIVVGDPAGEAKKQFIQGRLGVKHADDVLGCDCRLAVVQLDDDARYALLAKRHQHASAHDGCGIHRDTVSEDHVQGDGKGYVAEFGHWGKDKLTVFWQLWTRASHMGQTMASVPTRVLGVSGPDTS